MGRLSPREALGNEVKRRPEPKAPWHPQELPDVAIDLYDSALRHKDAEVRDVDAMMVALDSDPQWRSHHQGWNPEHRTQSLRADAERAAQIPRWYLREDLRGFDHIHPNREGHFLMAQLICPQLPQSWRCRCPPIHRGD